MSEKAAGEVYVHLLPTLIAAGGLRGGVAVVVDVLRATSVMVQGLASGCREVAPCGEIDEAVGVRDTLGAGSTVLAGERQGLPIAGFDRGNSPGDFTPEVCRGKTLVMTTTNGTRAILAATEADEVLVAAFSNMSATAGYLAKQPRRVHLVCAGTDGRVSLEDALLAGAVASRLEDAGFSPGNDEAWLARGMWKAEGFGETVDEERLFACLCRGRGGKRVREIGLEPDVREAAKVDRFGFVARLEREPLRIVKWNVKG